MISGTGNSIANGDYDSYLNSCSSYDPDGRCPCCLEYHYDDGVPECEAPQIDEDLKYKPMTLSKKQQWQRLVRNIKVGLEKLIEPTFIRNHNREMRKQYISDCKQHGEMSYSYWFHNYYDHKQVLIKLDQLNNI